jgi:predicted nucleic acid-binding protein
MKIFLDTNVVLDWLLDRKDTFSDEATIIIEAAEEGKLSAYISAGAVYTIAYILEKTGKKGLNRRKILQKILNILSVKQTDTEPYLNACEREMKDIEDAFQYEIALNGEKLDYFVTANIRDFSNEDTSRLPVITPLQMLNYL